MTYTSRCGKFRLAQRAPGACRKWHRRKVARLARRLTYALIQQRQREVDREIAGALARSGGRITDSMEREIMQKALASDWTLPQ
jgi:hypothetical protein